MRLHARPTMMLARREAKNDPCPQSCWTMKTRTRTARVGTPSASVSRAEYGKTKYIATQPARKGPNEVTSCNALSHPLVRANAAAACRTSASGLETPWSMVMDILGLQPHPVHGHSGRQAQ